MNYWITQIKEIFHHLRQYKNRTFMTMFGLVWGTITVILLMAFGTGLGRKLTKDMHGMGEGIAIVWPGRTTIPYEGYGRGRPIRLKEEDVELLRREVPELKRLSPEYSRWGVAVRYADKMNKPNITGIIPEYNLMRNIFPQDGGRWLNDEDINYRRRVAFLGNRLKDFLFGENADAVGKYVMVGETPFLVIGVLRPKNQDSSYSSRDRDRVFIPASTYKSIYGNRYIHNIVYQHRDPSRAKINEAKVYSVIAKKFTCHPDDKEILGIWDTWEGEKFMRAFSSSFTTFLGVIGCISLMVGGIGLANIMYVVVQERTREIGIRRSIGAKRRHIMGEFFLETFIIVGLSAMLGFALSIGMVKLINMFPIQDYVGVPVLSMSVALTAVGVLSSIGFLAGFFPARKAAMLDPVECLRY